MHLKLRRPGYEWLVYIEHVKFVETMLLTAFNALTAAARAELVRALPTRPEEAELRRAVSAAVDSYLALRPRLAAERSMPLAEPLAQQVLGVLRPNAAHRRPRN